jgi:16S rRNA G966 N2-methylase RsmD
MTDKTSPGREIPIDSIIITDRTRKDFGDINSLTDSISSVGLLQPIVINENNELIDGQRRIKAYIQLGRKEIPCYRVNLKEIILGEFHANSNRKDFTTSERVAISKAVEEIFRKHSRAVGRPRSNQKLDKNAIQEYNLSVDSTDKESNSENNVVNLTTFSGRINDNVSRYFGISRNSLAKEKEIVNAAEQNPETFDELRKKVDQKKISIDKAYHEIQKNIKKSQLLASVRNVTNQALTNNITLLNGDFREQSKTIPDDSIDLIFTDPTYAAESIPLYGDLAVIAHNALREGGSLVTYVGHYAIPKVIEMMEDAGLSYWWPIAVILSGSFARNFPRQVTIKWKPLLWFVKGDRLSTPDFLADVVKSDSPSKGLHEWEESLIEAEHVISRLTVEGQNVFDPMMGSGTTGVAAISLHRRFTGIEIDSDRFIVAKSRIAKAIDVNGNRIADSGIQTPPKMLSNKTTEKHSQNQDSATSASSGGICSNSMEKSNVDTTIYDKLTYEYLEQVNTYRCNRCKVIYDVFTKDTAAHPCTFARDRCSP